MKPTRGESPRPVTERTPECAGGCDFEKAKLVSRAKWVCPHCGRDYSLEYLFWAQAAHPEWFSPDGRDS